MARSPLIWMAEEGSITVGGNLYTAQVKDISITEPTRDAEIVNTFGNTSYMVTKAIGDLAETNFTAVARDAKFVEMLWGSGASTQPMVISGQAGTRYYQKIRYDWADPEDVSGAALRVTFLSGLAVSTNFTQSVDGHLEETISFKCNPSHLVRQSTNNRATNPLVNE